MRKITQNLALLLLTVGLGQLNAQNNSAELSNEVEIVEVGTPGTTNFVVTAGTLYSNGPIINMPGGGAGGNDLSLLESATLGMNILGFGHALSSGYRVADDVTFDNDVEIESLQFYAYQTGSTTTSTINNISLRIWAGSVDDVLAGTATVVWGDDFTNVLTVTEWSGVYRASETNPMDATRPVMLSTVEIAGGLTLPAGTYTLDWQSGGTLASGPWASPIAVLGETNTGNALQFDGSLWLPLIDTGTSGIENFPQGLPFEINGSEVVGIADNVLAGFSFYPNPSSDVINITSKATVENISIYNLLGQELLNVSVNGLSAQIDISGLSAGMYVMKATVDGTQGTFNVVKR